MVEREHRCHAENVNGERNQEAVSGVEEAEYPTGNRNWNDHEQSSLAREPKGRVAFRAFPLRPDPRTEHKPGPVHRLAADRTIAIGSEYGRLGIVFHAA